MQGIVIGAGVSAINIWIPNRGIMNWKELTLEDIRQFKKLYEK